VLKDLFESLKKINETESLFESIKEKFYPLNNSQGFTPREVSKFSQAAKISIFG